MTLNPESEKFSNLAAHIYESKHVHDVYESIATHFSETRYKPWPVVDSFIRSLNSGSIGLDVGCGNGKYLSVRNDIHVVASDYSTELVKIASQHEPHSCLVADTLNLPHPTGIFDFAICIAVVHHFSTHERRIEAVRHILETLRPPKVNTDGKDEIHRLISHEETVNLKATNVNNISQISKGNDQGGEALFFVWALEQKNSRRGWDEGQEQDVLVPWVLKSSAHCCNVRGDSENNAEQSKLDETTPTTYQRYYHLYRRNELEEDVHAAGGEVVRSGYDRDNWWCVARKRKSEP